MKTNSDIINAQITKHQGLRLPPGNLVAHPDDPYAYKLVRYDGDTAVLLAKDGTVKRFPASEIFDPEAVRKASVKQRIQEILKERAAALASTTCIN